MVTVLLTQKIAKLSYESLTTHEPVQFVTGTATDTRLTGAEMEAPSEKTTTATQESKIVTTRFAILTREFFVTGWEQATRPTTSDTTTPSANLIMVSRSTQTAHALFAKAAAE